jgi:hypothetical protein
MSYSRDLDEYATDELLVELVRRADLRKRGLCDYCERKPEEPPCRFHDRHRGSAARPTTKRAVRRTPEQWAELLVDNVSAATQLDVDKGELQNVEEWRLGARNLFKLAMAQAADVIP